MAKFYLNSARQGYGTLVTAGGAQTAYVWPIKVTDGITVQGLYTKVRTAPAGQTAIPVIYDWATKQLIAQGVAVVVAFEAETYAAIPVTKLLVGKTYAVGFYFPNHGNNVTIYREGNNYADGIKLTLEGGGEVSTIAAITGVQGTSVPTTLTSTFNWDPYTYGIEYTVTNYKPTINVPASLADQTAPFTYTYTITDAENNLKSVIIKLNGVIISQLTNTTQGTKNLAITPAQFDALALNKLHQLTVDVEDHDGKTTSAQTTFKRMPPADLSILESVDVINKSYDRLAEIKANLAAILGKPETTDFRELVDTLRFNNPFLRVVEGTTVATANGTNMVRGLTFKPTLVIMTYTSITSYYTAYIQILGEGVLAKYLKHHYWGQQKAVSAYSINNNIGASWDVPAIQNEFFVDGFNFGGSSGQSYSWIAFG